MFPYGWREVKSGEEFQELFTSPNALFIGVCEGWVKSEEYLAKNSAATYRHSPKKSECAQFIILTYDTPSFLFD